VEGLPSAPLPAFAFAASLPPWQLPLPFPSPVRQRKRLAHSARDCGDPDGGKVSKVAKISVCDATRGPTAVPAQVTALTSSSSTFMYSSPLKFIAWKEIESYFFSWLIRGSKSSGGMKNSKYDFWKTNPLVGPHP
jgi:hypothetical protein